MHEIGKIYDVNGVKYKLVEGEMCKLCCLYNKNNVCLLMPPCYKHKGHYEKV